MSDSRAEAARTWVASLYPEHPPQIQLLAGDASFRRYFRVTLPEGQSSRILMDAPPDKENSEPFVRIARHWHRHGIPVPDILAQEPHLGFILLEDFGDETLLRGVNAANADALYGRCIDALIHLLAIEDTPGLPRYDEALLRREMALFTDWLIERFLALPVPPGLNRLMTRWFDHLVDNALAQPQVTVHRDYHSRNLMLAPDDRIGIIDFQDAVIGPLTYDLVSLLKDCYIRWPEEHRERWMAHFHQCLPARLGQAVSIDRLREDTRCMGMQRHLKAAGIFARLWLRDGKPGYLRDIPNTVGYLEEALSGLPEFHPVRDWLQDTLQPALQARLAGENLPT